MFVGPFARASVSWLSSLYRHFMLHMHQLCFLFGLFRAKFAKKLLGIIVTTLNDTLTKLFFIKNPIWNSVAQNNIAEILEFNCNIKRFLVVSITHFP